MKAGKYHTTNERKRKGKKGKMRVCRAKKKKRKKRKVAHSAAEELSGFLLGYFCFIFRKDGQSNQDY